MVRGLVRRVAISLTAIAAILGGFSISSQAALPDEETYHFVTSRYTLLIEDETECHYYANPDTVSVNGNERSVLVLYTGGAGSGSMCNGLFEFQVLNVNCLSQEIAYSPQIASPANWADQEQRAVNPFVAEQICSLPW